MVLLPAGEALARDYLKLEARKEDLEDKRRKYLEELQNRQVVEAQRRAASLTVLDKRLRSEEKQHSLLKERNLVIRQQAAALCNPSATEVSLRIRNYRERFALDAERQSVDWNHRIELQLREEIASCRRDAQHCRQRQGEAIEVAMQQELLMVELAEAQSQAQEEREKLYGDVKTQHDRLRQRLWEQRQMMDDRVKALAPGSPRHTQDAEAPSLPERQKQTGGEMERTLRPVVRRQTGGYVPKEGTRQAEVYRRLLRNEAEMASELRLMEDRLVLRCNNCGFVGSTFGVPSELCECGQVMDVLRVPPKIAQGPFESAQTLPAYSVMFGQVFSTKPPAPVFAARGSQESMNAVTQPNAQGDAKRHRGWHLSSSVVDQANLSQNKLQAAQELAARSLERLAARRVQEDDGAEHLFDVHPESVISETGRFQPREEREEPEEPEPKPGEEPAQDAMDLGVLDVPLLPLAPLSSPRKRSGNDWYGSSSSSTPKGLTTTKEDPHELSSAEDVAFVEEASHGEGLDDVASPSASAIPKIPAAQEVSESFHEVVEVSSLHKPQVVQPQVLHPQAPEPLGVGASLGEKVDVQSIQDAMQDTQGSPASFTFGGTCPEENEEMLKSAEVHESALAEPVEELLCAHHSQKAPRQEETRPKSQEDSLVDKEPEAPQSVQTEPAAESAGPSEPTQSSKDLMNDLGLNEASEDEDGVRKDSALASFSLRKAKRSNPLSRGRGRGLLQGIGDSWSGLSGISQVSFSKASRSAPSLGGPIDWTQKTDFR